MKKMVVHRRREGPKQHPWLFLSGSVIVAGILIAGVVYLVVGRETPEKKAARLTRELAGLVCRHEWDLLREKMGVPETVEESEFATYVTQRHDMPVDKKVLRGATEIGEPRKTEEGVYEVRYWIRFLLHMTEREMRSVGVARWKYDEESGSMTYLIDEEMKEALEIE